MSSLLLSFFGVVAIASAMESLVARNNPPQPPCVYPYTKFVYSGCFVDSVSSRALPFMTELEFNNATVEQCTAYCKGNGYRYAGLEYHGQCFCGTSVSSSAASEAECNLPCNGDPTQVCGGEDRLSIYQDPTFPDADDIAISSDYKSLGCYTEGTAGRSLDYSQWDRLNASAMSTETCLTACGNKGFPFAGTEFGRECYCGVVLGNGTLPTDAGQCSSPCTGNSTETCGGPDHLSLYVAKNLESTDPCAPPIISSSTSAPTPTPTSSTPSSSSSSSAPTSSSSSSTPTPSSSSSTPTSSPSSSTPTPSTTKCVGYYCPISPPGKPTTSTSKASSSTPTPSTTKCAGYYCPISPPGKPTTSTSKPPTSTSKSSSSTPKPSTTTCVGYCPVPPPGKPTTSTSKTSTSTPTPSSTTKCSGYYCPITPPGKPSTSTSSPSPSKSSTSTPKTSSTTKCSGYYCGAPTTFHTTTTTPPWTPEIPPCEGILCWPPPNNPSTSCWLGLICAPATPTSSSKPALSTKKPTTTSAQGYPTVPKPSHY